MSPGYGQEFTEVQKDGTNVFVNPTEGDRKKD